MFCIKCGEKLPEGANFCFKCGTQLTGGTTGSVNKEMPTGAEAYPQTGVYHQTGESKEIPDGQNSFLRRFGHYIGISGAVLVIVILLAIRFLGGNGGPVAEADMDEANGSALVQQTEIATTEPEPDEPQGGGVIDEPQEDSIIVDEPEEESPIDEPEEDGPIDEPQENGTIDDAIPIDDGSSGLPADSGLVWRTVSDSSSSVEIPITWSYEIIYDGLEYLRIYNEDGSVDIFIGYIIAGDPRITIDQYFSQLFFFDDGNVGYELETPHSMMWINTNFSTCCGISLFHDGGRSVFTNNEDVILRIARSLTPVN